MAMHGKMTRRQMLAATACALPAGMAAAQQTDLRGMDPLWRSAEHAIRMFFGNVEFAREGIHLDLPSHADSGTSVPLTLRIDSAMTEEDCPEVVHVLAHENPSFHVMSVWFTPEAGRAEYSTRIRLETTQTVTAVAKMRDGRHLRVDREISVSFGACGQIGTMTEAEVFAFEPKPRVSVPEEAARGEIVPVRAVISHPMETGFRLDDVDSEWIRRRIISRFGCTYDGTEFFRARFYPAIATNPYISFFARASDSGTFRFSWYDTTDVTYTEEAALEVV